MQFGFRAFLLGIYCAPGSLHRLSTPWQDTSGRQRQQQGVNSEQKRHHAGAADSVLAPGALLSAMCKQALVFFPPAPRRCLWARAGEEGLDGVPDADPVAEHPCASIPTSSSQTYQYFPALQDHKAAMVQTTSKNEHSTKEIDTHILSLFTLCTYPSYSKTQSTPISFFYLTTNSNRVLLTNT